MKELIERMTLRRRGYLAEGVENERDIEWSRVGSFRLMVVRPKGAKPSKRFIEFIKQDIPAVAKAIRRTGIKVPLPEIHVFDEGEGASAWGGLEQGMLGFHMRGFDSIAIANLMGMSAHTLAHEIGHWLHERLPGRAIEYWQEMMKPRRTTVSESDVKDFIKKYFRNKKFMAMGGEDKQKYIRDHDGDVRRAAVFQAFVDSMINRSWSSDTKQENDKKDRERLKEEVGRKVFVSRVPFSLFHYAAKNEREAFAEFFSDYVMRGPRRADPGMRVVFKNVVGAGGHKIESVTFRSGVCGRSTMRDLIEHTQLLSEEKITDAWLKGVRKWWLQWKKGEKKALPDLDVYQKKHVCAAYEFLADGVGIVRRLRDNLLYVQGFWPYRGKGQKRKDFNISDFYPYVDAEGDVVTQEVKNFEAKFLYKMEEIENDLWGTANLFAKACNDFKGVSAQYEVDFWPRVFNLARTRLKHADQVLARDVLKQLKSIDRQVLEPLRKAQKKIGKNAELFGFKTALPEAKIGKVTLVLDTRAIEADPSRAMKDRSEIQRSPKMFEKYIGQAVKAQKMLQKSGFGKLWYGRITVQGKSLGAHTYKGSKVKMQAGVAYAPGDDAVMIYAAANRIAAQDILHEMGHRYWYRFMTAAQKKQWKQNFKKAEFASEYAGTDAEEEFAESFSYYVLGKLKGPHVERMHSVIRECVGGTMDRLSVLTEELAVFCEAVSEKKLREAKQMLGLHRQDGVYVRKLAAKSSGDEKKKWLKLAGLHDDAAEAFEVALFSKKAKDLKKAKDKRREALVLAMSA